MKIEIILPEGAIAGAIEFVYIDNNKNAILGMCALNKLQDGNVYNTEDEE